MTLPRFVLSSALVLAALADAAVAADPFAVKEFESSGRTLTAELADLDGDGATDLLQVVAFGMPPDQRRLVRVHLQAPDGTFSKQPSLEAALPVDSAAYDLADVDGTAGKDLLLLRPRGIGILSFRRAPGGQVELLTREARIPEDLTIGVAADERGLDRLGLVQTGFGDEPWLMAPGLVETFFLSPDGDLRARITSGSRANFFIESTALMISESDIQLFLDAPRISVGDVNGDGRADVVASQRHQLLVFYQDADGGFSREASQAHKLGRVSIEDHIRGSGAVRTKVQDIDRDGRADLIMSETRGGLMDSGFNTYIYFNRGSGWDLDTPDYALEGSKSTGADALIDLDGDARLELVHARVPISVFELIEIFLTEAIDANLEVYRLERAEDPPAEPVRLDSGDAWFKVKFDVPLDFETSRSAGFIPSLEHDFNGDGFRDYISSTDGERLEVFVGHPEKGYPKRSGRQDLATEGQIRSGDVDGDGLTDLVLFNTRRDNQPVKILINTGKLPGTVVEKRAAARAKP